MVQYSVIVPVYSVEKYLPECIDSIINQSVQDWELILVDDGSPDGSGVICDGYASRDSRIKVIHKQNEGVSVARNIGIENAMGKWVVFVDSDDFLLPSHLDDFHLDTHDDVDLAVQGLEYFDQRTKKYFSPKRLSDVLINDENLKAEVAKNNLLKSGYPVAKAYNAKLLKDSGIRFDKRISYHEDHIFVLEYMNLCHRILLSDSISYKYRYFHSTSSLSSKRHPWQNMELSGNELIKCLDEMKERFLVEGSEAYKSAYTFAYQCKIIAAKEVRATIDNYDERKFLYKRIINVSELQACYFPVNSKWIFIKFIISLNSLWLTDSVLGLMVFRMI